MSTNAYIGRPTENGGEGRYLHSDGYPTNALIVLADLIKTHGVETTMDTIVDAGSGWSTLEGKRTKRYSWHRPENDILFPGFGVAYREWEEPMDGETGESFEWCYVVHDDGLIFVLHNGRAVTTIRAQHVTQAKAQKIEDGEFL